MHTHVAPQCHTLSVLPSTSICSGGALSTNFFIVIFMVSCAFFKFYKEAHMLDCQATSDNATKRGGWTTHSKLPYLRCFFPATDCA